MTSPDTLGTGLRRAIEALLAEWGSAASFDDACAIWSQIEPDADVLALVDQLRRGGWHVFLATNQQLTRLHFMQQALGYGQCFDRISASCEIGESKPAAGFFRHVINTLKVPPERRHMDIIYVDDSAANVSATKAMGIDARQFHLDQGADSLAALLAGERT